MFKTIFPKELVWAKIQETPKCLRLKLSIKNLATVLKCNVFKNQLYTTACSWLSGNIYFDSQKKNTWWHIKDRFHEFIKQQQGSYFKMMENISVPLL